MGFSPMHLDAKDMGETPMLRKSPMRILMTADTVGGVWTYSLDLARALAPYGVEIHLATMGAPLSADQWEDVWCAANVTVHESHYKLEWMDQPWDDVHDAGIWLRGLQDRVQPDLVHLNGYAHGALAWDVPTVMVAHSCVCSWWEAVKRERAPQSWDCYRRHVTRGLKHSDLVIAPSGAMLQAIQTHYGPLRRTQVIHNGRDQSLYRPQAKAPFILTAGRLWDEAKNIALLERIAPTLHWPVCVAGDCSDPDGRTRPASNMISLGKLSATALAGEMSRAAIYALPARYEPFGLSALEAALSGCALVLGDIRSLREVWSTAAVFVNPSDHHELAYSIEELIRNPARRHAMAARAQSRASTYTHERMGRAYVTCYEQLLSQTNPVASAVGRDALQALPSDLSTANFQLIGES